MGRKLTEKEALDKMFKDFMSDPRTEQIWNKFDKIIQNEPFLQTELDEGAKRLKKELKDFDPKKAFALKADCIYLCIDPIVNAEHKVAFDFGDVIKPSYIKEDLILASDRVAGNFVDHCVPEKFTEINTSIAIDILQKIGQEPAQKPLIPDCYILCRNKEGKLGVKPVNHSEINETTAKFDTKEKAIEFYNNNKEFVEAMIK